MEKHARANMNGRAAIFGINDDGIDVETYFDQQLQEARTKYLAGVDNEYLPIYEQSFENTVSPARNFASGWYSSNTAVMNNDQFNAVATAALKAAANINVSEEELNSIKNQIRNEELPALLGGRDPEAAWQELETKINNIRFNARLQDAEQKGGLSAIAALGGGGLVHGISPESIPAGNIDYVNSIIGSSAGLTPEQRQKAANALERIERHETQALAAQLKVQEQDLKAAQAKAEKDLYNLAFDGKLTREAVEAQRDILSPSDYHKFLKLTQGELSLPDKSNPEAVIEITRMAINGDPDLQDRADEMLRTRGLTVSDYRSALNEGQQFRDPVIKQVMDEICLLTGVSEMNLHKGERESFVNAKGDFLLWLNSEAGENASARERLEMGRRIADRYRIISTHDALFTLRVPTFLAGLRTEPDIKATVEKTKAEYAAGRLTEEQYKEEAVRIKNIQDILERQRQQIQRSANTRSDRQ
jgi:hypothetical protein